MDDTSSSFTSFVSVAEANLRENLAGGDDMLEIEEVIIRVTGSWSGVFRSSLDRRNREILSEEEPALTERIKLACSFDIAADTNDDDPLLSFSEYKCPRHRR